MKIIDKEKLLKVINNSNRKDFSEEDFQHILEEYGDSWFFRDGRMVLSEKVRELDERKHMWKCEHCGARIKALGDVISKPKKCPSCGREEFV